MCHKLSENQAFAFLLANYDAEIIDLNRRNECLFRNAKDPVMNCMSQCDPMVNSDAINSEPIVVCYDELHDEINKMLKDFADCIQSQN